MFTVLKGTENWKKKKHPHLPRTSKEQNPNLNNLGILFSEIKDSGPVEEMMGCKGMERHIVGQSTVERSLPNVSAQNIVALWRAATQDSHAQFCVFAALIPTFFTKSHQEDRLSEAQRAYRPEELN